MPALAQVSGRPTAATTGAQMVTITAQDADANTAASDRAVLTFQVTVTDQGTLVASPSPLTEANPDDARLAVTLPGGVTFASAVSASSFERVANPALAGLSISGVRGGTPGSSRVALTLPPMGGVVNSPRFRPTGR